MTVPAQIWAPVINLFDSLRRVTFKNDIKKNAHILTQLDSGHSCPNFRRQWIGNGNIDNEMIEHNGILRIVSRAPHIRAIDMHVPPHMAFQPHSPLLPFIVTHITNPECDTPSTVRSRHLHTPIHASPILSTYTRRRRTHSYVHR